MSIDVASALSGSKELTIFPAWTRAMTGAADVFELCADEMTASASEGTIVDATAPAVTPRNLRREVDIGIPRSSSGKMLTVGGRCDLAAARTLPSGERVKERECEWMNDGRPEWIRTIDLFRVKEAL